MEENLELRIYGLVPYNISPIQQAIQFGHSVVEYGLHYYNDENYQDWAHNYKTFIILNGGTTNKQPDIVTGEPFGSMNRHLLSLHKNGIKLSTFYEPDLGDQLTAITFLVDERVFNREKYPNFRDYVINKKSLFFVLESEKDMIKSTPSITFENFFGDLYNEWTNLVGGPQNVFLREFLSQFKLA